VTPSFPFPELSFIVVPDVSDMSQTAAVVLAADAAAMPSPGTTSASAPVPTTPRHDPSRYITPPVLSRQRLDETPVRLQPDLFTQARSPGSGFTQSGGISAEWHIRRRAAGRPERLWIDRRAVGSRVRSVVTDVVEGHGHRELEGVRAANGLRQEQPPLKRRHDSCRERLGIRVG
jgi:hypothetical protein